MSKLIDILCELLHEVKSIRVALNTPSPHIIEPQIQIKEVIKEVPVEVIKEVEVPVEIIKEVEVPVEVIKKVDVPVDSPLTKALEPYRQFAFAFVQDHELARLFKIGEEDEIKLFLRVLAIASSNASVTFDIWECFAERCKKENRPANQIEQMILGKCVEIYNLGSSRPIYLEHIKADTKFDFNKHNRANLRGETIEQEWLPALYNHKGEREKAALVTTY